MVCEINIAPVRVRRDSQHHTRRYKHIWFMYFKVSLNANYVTFREMEKKKCPSRFRTLTDYHNNNNNDNGNSYNIVLMARWAMKVHNMSSEWNSTCDHHRSSYRWDPYKMISIRCDNVMRCVHAVCCFAFKKESPDKENPIKIRCFGGFCIKFTISIITTVFI
jgi:hypothetical protein